MVSSVFLMSSMFLELGLEVVVDGAATDIEYKHGIDVDKFWDMWRVNPGNFFGVHVVSSLIALQMAFWAFSTLPSPIFCTIADDPCSCKGGGFGIFKTFCNAIGAKPKQSSNHSSTQTNGTAVNADSTTTNDTLAAVKARAKVEYTGLVESLEGSSTTIIVTGTVIVGLERSNESTALTIVRGFETNRSTFRSCHLSSSLPLPCLAFPSHLIPSPLLSLPLLFLSPLPRRAPSPTRAPQVIIALIFIIARSQLAVAQAEKEKDGVELQRLELLEQNKRIQRELALNALNEEQAEIVHLGAAALAAAVPARFKIAPRKITFEALLGSGSFGDCYKGHFHNMPVAVKQMRVVSLRKSTGHLASTLNQNPSHMPCSRFSTNRASSTKKGLKPSPKK